MNRRWPSSAFGLIGAALALVLAAGAVSAHVGVNPAQVPLDSSQVFTVRVPTEKEEPTVQVRVEFPAGLTVSRFQPKPGWSYEVEKDASGKLAGVTWSGGKIGVGEFDDFVFIARTPKEPGPLAFKAYQTYQSGETIAWIGPKGDQRPAPTVEIKAAATAGSTSAPSVELTGQGAPGGAAATVADRSAGAAASSQSPLTSIGTFWMSIAALTLALIGLGLSALTFRRASA